MSHLILWQKLADWDEATDALPCREGDTKRLSTPLRASPSSSFILTKKSISINPEFCNFTYKLSTPPPTDMKTLRYTFFLWVILAFFSCGDNKLPYSYNLKNFTSLVQSPPSAESKFDDFSVDSIKIYIKPLVDSIRANTLYKIGGNYVFSKNVLPDMYAQNEYMLNWHDIKNRTDAMECLQNSWKDGLVPEDYHFVKLKTLKEEILGKNYIDYEAIAKFDILLTDGLLLYTFHLIKGKNDPSSLDPNWNFSSMVIPSNPAKIFIEAIDNKTIKETVYGFKPPYKAYQRLVEELQRFKEMQTAGGWDSVFISETIKPGDASNAIPAIRKRLVISGDLDENFVSRDSLYDESLVDAVKKFQNRHGLTSDGNIGKGTVTAMNIPVDVKIDKIRINLERARWILNNISNNMVVVNIPEFHLFYMRDSMIVHETKVMVGKYYHQTPVFKSKMKFIVFNPTWTVPYSIATKEILPKIKKNPNYLAPRNISLIDRNGKITPQSSVDWSKITAGNFPYTLRQEPGPGNALGKVKFMFPNKHSVYLHDTPSKYLFAREERAFSHGCIRVQNPLKLAEILLNDEKYDQKGIKKIIDNKKLHQVNLKEPIDVLLTYWTCGINEEDRIYFLKDVYNRDDRLVKGLSSTDWESLIEKYYREIATDKESK